MKKSIFLLSVIFTTLVAPAQNGIHWSVTHNKKELLKATGEDPVKNKIPVSLSNLKINGHFIISYWQANTAPGGKWIRTIALFTTTDSVLYRKDLASVAIEDVQLAKLLQENKTVEVYTWALPKDPKEAARVRIRRVHLCTIELI